MITLRRNAAACDESSCDTWSREPEAHGFLQITWGSDAYLFCKPDCALRWLADNSAPAEVVSFE